MKLLHRIVVCGALFACADTASWAEERPADASAGKRRSSDSNVLQTMPAWVVGGSPKAESQPASIKSTPKLVAAPFGPSLSSIPPQRFMVLSPLSAQTLAEAHARNAREGIARLQIGLARSFSEAVVLNSNTVPASQWSLLPNGWRIWSINVSSPGALGLRLHLKQLSLPEGARVVLYDPAQPGPDPAPVTRQTLAGESEVWTPTLFADTAVVEVQVPPEVDTKSLQLTLEEVSHLYALPLSTGILKEGTCHNDVTCYPAYANEAAGVARMAYVAGGNTYVCSGCLISSSDSNPGNYFLTANHCIPNQSLASTIELFWFYQTSTCKGTPPALSSVPTTTGGADLLATSTANDFCFLRLRQAPPQGAFFLSWSTDPPSSSETLAIIHHPTGAYKRISFGHLVGSNSDFWGVQWTSGVTEDGSSGGPLLNGNHQIIGQLNGGFNGPGSSCSNPTAPDQFGRFDLTYPQISQWLGGSPSPGGFVPVKGVYNGLFSDPGGVDPSSAGSFSMSVNTRGRFAGTLKFNNARYGFSGQLDSNGTAQPVINRHGVTLQLTLQVDPNDSDHITGTLTDGNFNAALDGDREVFDGRGNVPAQVGRYTAVIPGDPTSAAPDGTSYFVISVDKAGRMHLSGMLADHTAIAQTSFISKNGRAPLFLGLYGNQGLITGWVMFGSDSSTGPSGTLTWIKPSTSRARYYPGGFDYQGQLGGSPFVAPTRGSPILGISDANVTLSGGDLDSQIVDAISLNANNRVSNLGSDRLNMSFSPSTGMFHGSVTTAPHTSFSFSGVVMQSSNSASGFFLGPDQSGQVQVSQ